MDKKIIEKILFIRRFEEKIIEIYHTDVIKSPVHLSIGQELFSVLLADNIKKGDKIIYSCMSSLLLTIINILWKEENISPSERQDYKDHYERNIVRIQLKCNLWSSLKIFSVDSLIILKQILGVF